MNSNAQRFIAITLALSPLLSYGDSSYRETTQLTGGQLIDSLKHIPFMSKQLKSMTDPTTTTTMVSGNKKAVVTAESTEIYDLDRQQIVHIDTVNKQYSVDTFADMRKMMATIPDKLKQAQAQVAQQQAQQPQMPPSTLQCKFAVTVDDTGVQQVVNGLNAKQQILKLTATVTDTSNPGTSVTYTMTSEIWTTPDVPAEMKDAQEFDVRFAQALMSGVDLSAYLNLRGNSSNAAMTQMFVGKPGATEAFEQMGKEMAKIKGTRILEKTSMGGSGTGTAQPAQPQSASSANPPADTGTGGNVMRGMAQLGGLGGIFGKKKSQPADTAPPTGSATPAQSSGEATLLETTTQKSNFSRDPVPASVFEIPAGFKQVPSRLAQALATQ